MKTIRTMVRVAVILTLFCSVCISNLHAQTASYPWPQSLEYDYGTMPDNANAADAYAAYTSWRTTYVTDAADGTLRVKWDSFSGFSRGSDVNSVSEGIAYGMILSAYAGDKTTFDGLWAYYQKFPTWNTVENSGSGFQTHIMNWKTCNPNTSTSYVDEDGSCSDGSTIGTGGATDAEFDAAMALIVASYQWPTDPRNYEASAVTLIQEMRQLEFLDNGIMKPGDSWRDDQDITNISYFSPAYYKVFAQYDDEAFWNSAVEQCYTILNKAVNSDGLVPDWCTKDGTKSLYQDDFEEDGEEFLYDAVRTPLRIAIDYLWFNESRASDYCALTTQFAINKGGVANLESGYRMSNSTSIYPGSNNNPTFMGCFAIGGMTTTNQSFMDASYTSCVNTQAGTGHYFDATIRTLSLFIMTGNFYLPPPDKCDKPSLGDDVSLCAGTLTLNTNVSTTNRTFKWYKGVNQLTSETGSTLSLSTGDEGVYRVISDSAGCVRSDLINVYQDELEADFTYAANPANNLEIFFTDASKGLPVSHDWTLDGTSGITDQNPIYDFGNPGLYLATLVVENECGETDTKTAEITIGTACSDCPGWFTSKFTEDLYNDLWVDAPTAITLDKDHTCTSMRATVAEADMDKDWYSVGVTIKDGADDGEIDVSNYPYARFKIKLNQEMDSIRVDLGQSVTDPSDADALIYPGTDKNPVYLKGTRNPDGTYNTIPANEWIVSTLDYTDRWESYAALDVDPTKISQIKFVVAEAALRESKDFELEVDWVIIGNEEIGLASPDVSIAESYQVCEGNSVEIDATSCEAESYSWSHGPTTPIVNLPGGNYEVTITNAGGDSVIPITVIEVGTPTPSFTYTTDGLTVEFTNTTIGGTSYSWDFDEGATTSSLDEPTITFNASGTFNVCLTAYSAIGIEQCSDDTYCEEITLCVLPDDAGAMTGSASVCEDEGCVTYEIAAVTGATDYIWEVPTGASICTGDGTNEVTIDFDGASSGDVTVTPSSGCAEGAAATIAVEVNSAPGTITVTGPAQGCEDGTGTYTVSGGSTGSTYDWTLPNGITGTNNGDTYDASFDLTTDGVISVVETSADGCVGAAATTPVEVFGKPTTSAISGLTETCWDETGVAYEVTATTGSTYDWSSTGATIASGDGSNSVMVNFAQTAASLSVIETSQDGCLGDEVTLDITTEECIGLIANFSASETSICPGESVTFTNASQGAISYSWDFDGAAVTSTDENPSAVTFADAGTYTIILTATNDASETDDKELIITVNEKPSAATIQAGATECYNAADQTVNAIGGLSGSEFVWSITAGDATITSGGVTSSITVDFGTENTTFQLVETSSEGCVGDAVTANVIVEDCTPDLNAGITVSTTDVCEGTTVTFTDNSFGDDPDSYTWGFGSNATPASATGPGPHEVSFSTIGNETVTLEIEKVVDGVPYSDNTSQAVSIIDCSGLTALFELSENTVCTDNSITVTDASTNTTIGTTEYAWDFGVDATPATGDGTDPYDVSWSSPGEKTISLTITNPGGVSNGWHESYAKDDFAQADNYGDAVTGKGVYWWTGSAYSMTRDDANSRLELDVTDADPTYTTFGLGFGDTEGDGTGTDFTMDLSSNATLAFDIENTHATEDLVLTMSLKDISGNQVEILKDTTTSKDKATVNIGASSTESVTMDLLGGYTVVNWACAGTTDCPTLGFDFDFTKVTGVGFHINGGAGVDNTLDAFTGTVYISDFTLGSAVAADAETDTYTSTVTVEAGPDATITGEITACEDETGAAFSVPVQTGVSYAWSAVGATVVSGATTNEATVDYGTTDATINVVVTSAACSSNGSVDVTVSNCSDPIEADFITTGDVVEICEGQSIEFINATLNEMPTETYSYDWTFDGPETLTSTDENPEMTFTTSGVYTVTLTVEDAGATVSDSEVKTSYITVNALGGTVATVEVDGGSSICGTSSEYNAIYTNGGTAPTFTWYLNDSDVGETSDTYNATGLAVGDEIYVEMESNSECVAAGAVTSDVITITSVSGIDDIEITSTADKVNNAFYPECNSSVTYTATSYPGAKYIWNISSGTATTATVGVNVNTVDVDYGSTTGGGLVSLTVQSSGCDNSSTSSIIKVCGTDVPTGIEGLLDNATIEVYPNPFVETTTLVVKSDLDGKEVSIELYDLAGVLVETTSTFVNEETTVGVELASGTYIAKVVLDNQVATLRVVKN